MRFITEFEVAPDVPKEAYQQYVKAWERRLGFHMGNMIVDSFDWNLRGGPIKERHALEIEAFPKDKWVEFKRDLLAFLDLDSLQYKTICDRISELESFGKPAGEQPFSVNPPVEKTGAQYFLDTKEEKVYKQHPDGRVEDLTNDDPAGAAKELH